MCQFFPAFRSKWWCEDRCKRVKIFRIYFPLRWLSDYIVKMNFVNDFVYVLIKFTAVCFQADAVINTRFVFIF